MKKEEIAAIILSAFLILAPLIGGVIQNLEYAYGQNTSGGNYGNHPVDIQGCLTLLVSGLTLFALIFQAWTNHRQRDLMEGQLKATQTAADAALAALNRPWLVVEILSHNERDWREGLCPLIVEFQIANYGNAPAFIKSMRLLHFRAFNEQMGSRPEHFPGEFIDCPEPDRFFHVLYRQGRIPQICSAEPTTSPAAHKANEFILAGGEKTERLFLIGYRQVDPGTFGIDPVFLTKSFFAGYIFHEFPGRRAETLMFCYHRDDFSPHFTLFRDYAPYNGRKEEKGAQ